ncbi:hypothetical protein [Ruania rhizosphaerae]|uniref:hypothetical protein n=1 Tax=Ruania rhizosphaerae TaxID=1840413 RepID=UPI001357F536|nr:hypothetical protein [Ruania rhizosphaerae]
MAMPIQHPHAVFSGAWGDTTTGAWYPAQAVVSAGIVTLWIGSAAAGWTQHFSVPAREVTVKSAAQRITLVVGGRSYPILADPGAVSRALGFTSMGIVGGVAHHGHRPYRYRRYRRRSGAAWDVARGVNQAAAAYAFNARGGGEFLSAVRASGARVSRLGYGALAAIGCGGGVLVVFLVVAMTLALL